MKQRTSLKDVLVRLALLVLIVVIIYSGLRILEATVLHSSEISADTTTSKAITRNGVKYFPRQDITVLMVLGIDQYGEVQSSNYYRNKGSADSVMLLIFDETAQDCTALYLNRDTMLTMDVLGVRGEYAGTTYGQLALAHTYGTGLEDSCENVKNTLMNFIHGLTIDYYLSMNMDAIPALNDAVGGVTVNVKDDFSLVNPSITMGELTLNGDQVIDYVRRRKDVGDQKNITRMERQKEYVESFLKSLYKKAHGNETLLLSMYEDVSPYIVTDCSATTLSSLMERYGEYTVRGAVTPEGDNRIEDDHYAFYVDEEKLDELIVELFYRAK